MRDVLLNWFKLYEEEIAIFLWTAALLFLVRSSGMILNNYAETTFLKRYGVEYLPIVNMLNSIATLVVTGILAAIMARLPGAKLLAYLFVFCGASVAAIRFLIPLGYDLIYPVLFMLKSQFELLQALLFWNLANDLFNTRQSKRIFPLLTAGGVIGLIIGSFGTPYLARAFRFDNMLFVYLGITLLGALLLTGMSRQVPQQPRAKKQREKSSERTPMLEELKKVLPLLRESALLKIVLILSFMPNVVIPIMNYQFNFAVNEYFATESGMLEFFGYFRGILNIINLVILLFVGRLYGRFGLPVALMFHPFNYMIAFMAFLLRFDIFSAVYARMSTNILRTTINIPANSILIGLFPESYRALVRPFLRGTVVRAGLFLGSGLILASANYFHPRYLSLVALPFVLAWVIAPFILKKRYASILMDLISKNLLDLKSLEEENLGNLFKADAVGDELIESFLQAKGADALWYARLLKNLNVKNLDRLILSVLDKQDVRTRIQLLDMLSDHPGPDTARRLKELIDPNIPELTVAVLKTIKRIDPPDKDILDLKSFLEDSHPEVRGQAAGCLYQISPENYRSLLDSWLDSGDHRRQRAGIIAAGESGDEYFVSGLKTMLKDESRDHLIADILKALSKLDQSGLNDLALDYLNHPQPQIRLSALQVLNITNENILKKTINFLGDPEASIRELAKEKIKNGDYVNGQTLIESLGRPNRRLREAVFDLLENLNIRDLDLYRFTREGLEEAYTYLAKARALDQMPENHRKDLLREHLYQKKNRLLEDILRVMAIHSQDSRMRTVFMGLFSRDSRQKANSIELLGDIMDRKLFEMFLPLIEGSSLYQTLAAGRQFFKLPGYDSPSKLLFPALLQEKDWIEVLLALNLLKDLDQEAKQHTEFLNKLLSSPNPHLRQLAEQVVDQFLNEVDSEEQVMDNRLTTADKILLLKKIAIFSDLTVSELGAIAAVTEEKDYPQGEIVIKEGEQGEQVFLIIAGEVEVVKQQRDKEIRLDTMEVGNYFGEMALFEEARRSATIRTKRPSRFLVLHKQEFNELVREYPRIALQICTALSHRLRNLQSKLTQGGA
ncbi:MAG: cyclic nucleotide-binding domain-containing protein [Desulfohalobiaceae bacterium]|nr:cyclic nucleotide-binding domain-containing protein [Desulfohalobiaceae bacterium]